jgi:hypothetical protein
MKARMRRDCQFCAIHTGERMRWRGLSAAGFIWPAALRRPGYGTLARKKEKLQNQ